MSYHSSSEVVRYPFSKSPALGNTYDPTQPDFIWRPYWHATFSWKLIPATLLSMGCSVITLNGASETHTAVQDILDMEKFSELKDEIEDFNTTREAYEYSFAFLPLVAVLTSILTAHYSIRKMRQAITPDELKTVVEERTTKANAKAAVDERKAKSSCCGTSCCGTSCCGRRQSASTSRLRCLNVFSTAFAVFLILFFFGLIFTGASVTGVAYAFKECGDNANSIENFETLAYELQQDLLEVGQLWTQLPTASGNDLNISSIQCDDSNSTNSTDEIVYCDEIDDAATLTCDMDTLTFEEHDRHSDNHCCTKTTAVRGNHLAVHSCTCTLDDDKHADSIAVTLTHALPKHSCAKRHAHQCSHRVTDNKCTHATSFPTTGAPSTFMPTQSPTCYEFNATQYDLDVTATAQQLTDEEVAALGEEVCDALGEYVAAEDVEAALESTTEMLITASDDAYKFMQENVTACELYANRCYELRSWKWLWSKFDDICICDDDLEDLVRYLEDGINGLAQIDVGLFLQVVVLVIVVAVNSANYRFLTWRLHLENGRVDKVARGVCMVFNQKPSSKEDDKKIPRSEQDPAVAAATTAAAMAALQEVVKKEVRNRGMQTEEQAQGMTSDVNEDDFMAMLAASAVDASTDAVVASPHDTEGMPLPPVTTDKQEKRSELIFDSVYDSVYSSIYNSLTSDPPAESAYMQIDSSYNEVFTRPYTLEISRM
ncbi:hypothetical protein CYMTET_6336 [Cymbomonas tetramitiformis]|uniref:Uncharacterized protein n=1 Tax=Cymbomonas tetramitiformis TaxID=36881 RepID=A0AAE0GZ79_9CHLO|nr:hypothetical protein CYMTET_6336 [Cymbomonas tetramitiformis]